MTTTTSLIDLVTEHLASNKLELPVLAPSALELQNILGREDANVDEIARRIMQDQALAVQVLRMANSAFYGGLKQISTIKDAIMRLGMQEVLNIVILTTSRQNYVSKNRFLAPHVSNLWRHASTCAMASQFLARRLGHDSLLQETFMSGLLHDIGHLFLLKVVETIDTEGRSDIGISQTVLDEVLAGMHASQGTLLLQKWNLPELYCDVARLHHEENYNCSNTVVTIVRLADAACHKLGVGLHTDPGLVLATTEESKALHVPEVLLAELEIMIEDAAEAIS